MEERIMDDEESRGIKLVHKPEGDDVVDAQLAGEDGENYDEDLVGLTPSQLEEALEKRKKEAERAQAEYEKLIKEGDEAYAAGEFEGAATLYRQAAVYREEAREKVFEAVTEGFTKTNYFYEEGGMDEFYLCPPEMRSNIAGKLKPILEEEEKSCRAEAEPLREQVEAGIASRREAFAANKHYYFVRFLAVLSAFLMLLIGVAVAGSFILRTADAVPLIVTIVLGVLAVGVLGVLAVYCRKLYAAASLCRTNEKLSSTENGARLEALDTRLSILEALLDEVENDEAGETE